MAQSDNIIPEQIDELFPIAGQDNDTQGFRDNFAAIQTSLVATKTAIQDLETKAIVKQALSGTNLDNNMQGNTISNGVLLSMAEESFNTGNIVTNADGEIFWTNGSYQNITMANPSSVRLILGGWPVNGVYAKMRLALRSNSGDTRALQFEAANAGTLRVDPSWPTGTFTVTSATSPKIVDVWTVDGGITVFMQYIGTFEILS